jgi:hypothetical protein
LKQGDEARVVLLSQLDHRSRLPSHPPRKKLLKKRLLKKKKIHRPAFLTFFSVLDWGTPPTPWDISV